MSLRWSIAASILFTMIFIGCCYTIYYESERLSASETGVTAFVALMGISLFSSPIFIVRSVRLWLRGSKPDRPR